MSEWEGLNPPYATIVADPPWRYSDQPPKGGAGRKYTTTGIDDICAMPVADLAAPSAHLWVWGTNALMDDAYRVVRAWGFSPITVVTWCKRGPGVGHYLRNNTEHIILASRGSPMTPAERPLSTWYVWPNEGHSRKPQAALDLIEKVSPGPYVELFARQPRLGWDHWGHGYEGQVA